MRKLFLLTLLFFCIGFSNEGFAKTETMNWCGTYFEENNISYLFVSQEDYIDGSKNCSIENFKNSIRITGIKSITLDFTKNRSKIGNWRKFQNHLIEIRGKLHNDVVSNARLVRDYGI